MNESNEKLIEAASLVQSANRKLGDAYMVLPLECKERQYVSALIELLRREVDVLADRAAEERT